MSASAWILAGSLSQIVFNPLLSAQDSSSPPNSTGFRGGGGGATRAAGLWNPHSLVLELSQWGPPVRIWMIARGTPPCSHLDWGPMKANCPRPMTVYIRPCPPTQCVVSLLLSSPWLASVVHQIASSEISVPSKSLSEQSQCQVFFHFLRISSVTRASFSGTSSGMKLVGGPFCAILSVVSPHSLWPLHSLLQDCWPLC